MPLDVLGRTRVTQTEPARTTKTKRPKKTKKTQTNKKKNKTKKAQQRGIPSKRKSSTCADYVPALCTHRPSLLPIGWFCVVFGLDQRDGQLFLRAGKLSKLGHLEEVKVVTRSPLVNQRRDHYRAEKLPNPLFIYLFSCFGRRPQGGASSLLTQVPAAGAKNSVICYHTESKKNESKLSTTDLLVLATMKNAAKCDK